MNITPASSANFLSIGPTTQSVSAFNITMCFLFSIEFNAISAPIGILPVASTTAWIDGVLQATMKLLQATYFPSWIAASAAFSSSTITIWSSAIPAFVNDAFAKSTLMSATIDGIIPFILTT